MNKMHILGICSGDRIIKLGAFKNFDYDLSIKKDIGIINPEEQFYSGYKDTVYFVYRPAHYQDIYRVSVNKNPCNRINYDVTLSSTDTTFLSSPIDNIFYSNKNGLAYIKSVDDLNREKYYKVFTYLNNSNVESKTATGNVSGSVLYDIIENTENLCTLGSGIDFNLFSTKDNDTNNYIYNTGCWASSLDFSAVSVWNSSYGYSRCGTLISPVHIAMANHYPLNTGDTIKFVDKNNTICSRVLLNTVLVTDDIRIGVLDTPVIETIHPYKLLPNDYLNYLYSYSLNYTGYREASIITTNQFREIFINHFKSVDFTGIYFSSDYPFHNPITIPYYKDIIEGDSSCPLFFNIQNELIFLSTWTWTQGGNMWSYYLDLISGAAQDLNPDYSISTIDLSPFTKY